MDDLIFSALTRSGNLSFNSNRLFANDIPGSGCRVVRQSSGHLVLYGPHNRRILTTDPEGNPLHECEWFATARGAVRLARARFRLDWGQWVGLKPEGLVNSTIIDLSKRPGWEGVGVDDLRLMAAHALQVPLDEVRFFYNDKDLAIDHKGQATIRHRKDALYMLEHGTCQADFSGMRFMACMGAMHWDRIDFLPVVELFQSLLPGTGSAAFELIRGLYDDQNQPPAAPLPLRYRGIPPYPSPDAYRLFSDFFISQASGSADAFSLFMDPHRSHEVRWLPSQNAPRRYFDIVRKICVTVKGSMVGKATLSNDTAGLSFTHVNSQGFAPYHRSVSVDQGHLILKDGNTQTDLRLSPSWGPISDSPPIQLPSYSLSWRDLFRGALPQVDPQAAFSAVLMYPEDESEISESASQPFVADHLQDAMNQYPEFTHRLSRVERVLIHNFDATFASCLTLDRPRTYTVLYHRPEFAQKQAQAIWNRLALTGHLDRARQIALYQTNNLHEPEAEAVHSYDLIYEWVPFSQFCKPVLLSKTATAIACTLDPKGLAFIVGPLEMGEILSSSGLLLIGAETVRDLPTFHMHQSILPKGYLKSGLTLFYAIRAEDPTASAKTSLFG